MKPMKTLIFFISSLLLGIAIMFTFKIGIRQTTKVISPNPKNFSFSLRNAPSETIKGKITSLTGDIGWQSRVATEPAKIKIPQDLQQGEGIVTEKNGKAVIQFGSYFASNLAANTSLEFIQTLPSQFVIKQNKGKAEYVKIDTTPLTIRSFGLLLNIDLDSDVVLTTNEKLGVVTAAVKKGTITASYYDSQNETTNILTINEGYQYVFDDGAEEGSVEPI